MEAVYQKERCSWVSEKICLRDYFSSFSAALPIISSSNASSNKNKVSETNSCISKLMGVSFTEDQMEVLSETCGFVYNVKEAVLHYRVTNTVEF
jgi:hypothetical protein